MLANSRSNGCRSGWGPGSACSSETGVLQMLHRGHIMSSWSLICLCEGGVELEVHHVNLLQEQCKILGLTRQSGRVAAHGYHQLLYSVVYWPARSSNCSQIQHLIQRELHAWVSKLVQSVYLLHTASGFLTCCISWGEDVLHNRTTTTSLNVEIPCTSVLVTMWHPQMLIYYSWHRKGAGEVVMIMIIIRLLTRAQHRPSSMSEWHVSAPAV
jgi:hypothetical protein